MPEWNVVIAAKLAGGASGPDRLLPATVASLSDELERHTGVGGTTTSVDQDVLEIRFGVAAEDPHSAVRSALQVWDTAAEEVGLAGTTIDQVEVLSDEALDRKMQRQGVLPKLVGLAEVSELLGVTKGRMPALRKSNPQFPKPLAYIKAGPIWSADGIERFRQTWPRLVGRPRAEAHDAYATRLEVERDLAQEQR
ncbi:MAG: hypothetical protein M3N98_13105 [Actinomycetota bacterium]|nr:hypothetical protein [Actinomycetota bacterium]